MIRILVCGDILQWDRVSMLMMSLVDLKSSSASAEGFLHAVDDGFSHFYSLKKRAICQLQKRPTFENIKRK